VLVGVAVLVEAAVALLLMLRCRAGMAAGV
jgi:hypothetical protein